MKQWKEDALIDAKCELPRLKELGYEFVEFSEYHWRFKKRGTWITVDVWASSLKAMQTGHTITRGYRSIEEVLKYFFDRTEGEKEEKAQKEVADFRKDPLSYLKLKTTV